MYLPTSGRLVLSSRVTVFSTVIETGEPNECTSGYAKCETCAFSPISTQLNPSSSFTYTSPAPTDLSGVIMECHLIFIVIVISMLYFFLKSLTHHHHQLTLKQTPLLLHSYGIYNSRLWYILSINALCFLSTTPRFNFNVGVSSPVVTLKS